MSGQEEVLMGGHARSFWSHLGMETALLSGKMGQKRYKKGLILAKKGQILAKKAPFWVERCTLSYKESASIRAREGALSREIGRAISHPRRLAPAVTRAGGDARQTWTHVRYRTSWMTGMSR